MTTITYNKERGSLHIIIQGQDRGWTFILDKYLYESMSLTALSNYVREREEFYG